MTGTEALNRDAARKGAEKLDQIDPNWFDETHIDLDRLDLSSPTACVAGQLLEMHWDVPDLDYVPDPIREKFYEEANGGFIEAMKNYSQEYGFEIADDSKLIANEGIQCQYEILDDEWKSLIRERRARAGKA
jgi:hypothetical protein